MKISIIIPFHNEEGNLTNLFNEIKDNVSKKHHYEIIFVNDGSTDEGVKEVNKLVDENKNTTLISQRKRFGKGRTLKTGFEKSTGDIVIFIDADLQDNPKNINPMVDKIIGGYDFINGWRKARLDNYEKTWPSRIFNKMLLIIFKSKFHDINCGLKVMRRQVLIDIPLYGDNYRFLPLLAEKEGFKTEEVEVDHRKRQVGKSKYGFIRLFFGLIDTLTTYFIYRFSEKPLHFFGVIGGILFAIGFAIASYLAVERLFNNVLLYRRPILQLAILLIIIGIQIVLTGVLAELIVYLRQKTDKKLKI